MKKDKKTKRQKGKNTKRQKGKKTKRQKDKKTTIQKGKKEKKRQTDKKTKRQKNTKNTTTKNLKKTTNTKGQKQQQQKKTKIGPQSSSYYIMNIPSNFQLNPFRENPSSSLVVLCQFSSLDSIIISQCDIIMLTLYIILKKKFLGI